jgi:uncharacterized membrane-anchored protein
MEIKNYKPINSGCLKSSFTIVIPEWANQEVDCTYFEKNEGAYWVNYAPREYMTKEGKKKSWNQTRWPQPVTERLTQAIRDKVRTMPDNEVPIKEEIGADEELPF